MPSYPHPNRPPLHAPWAAAAFVLSLLFAPVWGGGGDGDGFISVAWAGSPGYVEGIEDLPLAPGLQAVPEKTLIFNKPSGRIVEAEARGDVSAAVVQRFYRDTAPQLGWRPAGHDRFIRAGEVLRLEFRGGKPLTLRFTLSPE